MNASNRLWILKNIWDDYKPNKTNTNIYLKQKCNGKSISLKESLKQNQHNVKYWKSSDKTNNNIITL